MAIRKALVVGPDGRSQQLQSGHTLNVNAFFTGTANLPALALLLGNGNSPVAVTSKIVGDALATGECITVTPASALPLGLNISYAIVTATNTVQIGFSASFAISGASMGWTVVADR